MIKLYSENCPLLIFKSKIYDKLLCQSTININITFEHANVLEIQDFNWAPFDTCSKKGPKKGPKNALSSWMCETIKFLMKNYLQR